MGCALLSSCSEGLCHLAPVLTLSVFFLLPLLLCQSDFRQAFSLSCKVREWNWRTLSLTTRSVWQHIVLERFHIWQRGSAISALLNLTQLNRLRRILEMRNPKLMFSP